ncbi:hypothetical protein AB4254_11175 [Vibrio breoganii]
MNTNNQLHEELTEILSKDLVLSLLKSMQQGASDSKVILEMDDVISLPDEAKKAKLEEILKQQSNNQSDALKESESITYF